MHCDVDSNRDAEMIQSAPPALPTLGLFDEHILEVAGIIHKAGGLLYYDGANALAVDENGNVVQRGAPTDVA